MPGNSLENTNQGSGSGGSTLYYRGNVFKISNLKEDTYSGLIHDDGTVTSVAMTDQEMIIYPLICNNLQIDAISIQVGTAGAGSTVYAGIYSTVSDRDDRPGNILLSTSFDTTTTGLKDSAVTQTTLDGRYWLAILGTTTIAMPSVYGPDNLGAASSHGRAVLETSTAIATAGGAFGMVASSKTSLPSTITWGDFSTLVLGTATTHAAPFLKITRTGL